MGSTVTATVSTRLDHLGVVGHDIDRLVDLYRRLGFTVSNPVELRDGSASMGQHSAHFVFQDTYIELTAPDKHAKDHHLTPLLARHPGLHLLGFNQGPAGPAADFFTQSGFETPEVRSAERDADGPSGTETAKFKWFKLPDAFCDVGFVFSVEHLTPELVFSPQHQDHENKAYALKSVTVVVDDLEEAFSRFSKLPGTDTRTFAAGRIIVMGDHRLILVTQDGLATLFPDVPVKDPPYCAGMAFQTSSLEAVKAVLDKGGVTWRAWGDRAIWVHPDETGGPIVQFLDESERRDTPRFLPGRPGRAPQPVGKGFDIADDGHS